MKYLHFLIFFFLIFNLISCETEEIEGEPPFDFIRFEMDGEEILLTEKYQAPSANTYYLIPEDGLDAITIIMNDKEYLVELNISSAGIFSQELPYNIDDSSNPLTDGYMGVKLIDQTSSLDTIFSERDSINYSGNNFEGFSIVITSVEDDIFRGSFEGIIRTKSEPIREKIISNGRLKVAMDIIIE